MQPSQATIVLCQDGIAVDQVPLPQGDDVESKLLARNEVLLDLRGDGRVALDLSRNLPETGIDGFWKVFVPKVWDVIAAKFPDDEIVRRSLSYLAESELIRAKSDPLRFVRIKSKLLRGQRDLVSDIQEVFVLDTAYSDKGGAGVIAPSSVVWLAPPIDLHPTGDFSAHVMSIGDLRVGYIPKKAHTFSSRLDDEWKRLIATFSYVGPWNEFSGCLSRLATNPHGNIAVSEVIGFQVSAQWLCLRNPARDSLALVPVPVHDDIAQQAHEEGLSLADYYLCLIYLVWGGDESVWTSAKGQWADRFLAIPDRLKPPKPRFLDSDEDSLERADAIDIRRLQKVKEETRRIDTDQDGEDDEAGSANAYEAPAFELELERETRPGSLEDEEDRDDYGRIRLLEDDIGDDDDNDDDDNDDDGDDTGEMRSEMFDTIDNVEREAKEIIRDAIFRFAGVAEAVGLANAVPVWERVRWEQR